MGREGRREAVRRHRIVLEVPRLAPLVAHVLAHDHVLELHAPVFEGGRRVAASEDLRELRAYCQRQLGEVREDVLRPLNPTPYKTSVSAELFSFLQDALQRHQPITELT